MNSRVTITDIAHKLNCSRNAVKRRIDFLGNELKIKYVTELDERELGFAYNYIIRAKLKKPIDKNTLLNYLKHDPVPQFAAFTKGDFDLIIYATAKTHNEYCEWEYWMRYLLRDHLENWNNAHFLASRYGFFPLHENALETISLPTPRKEILLLLNRNSRISLKDLAKSTKLSHPTARYHVTKLEESRVVRRFTAIAKKPPKSVHFFVFWTYRFNEGFEERAIKVRKIIRDEPEQITMNKCSFIASLSGTADEVALLSYDDIERGYEEIKLIDKIFAPDEVKTESGIITQVIYGELPFRNTDISKLYDVSWPIYKRVGSTKKETAKEKLNALDYLNEFNERWGNIVLPQIDSFLKSRKPYLDVTQYFKNTKSRIFETNIKNGKHVYALCFDGAKGMVDKFEITEKGGIQRDSNNKLIVKVNASMVVMGLLDLFVPFLTTDEILPFNRTLERPYGLDPKRVRKTVTKLGKDPRKDLICFFIQDPQEIDEKIKLFLVEFRRLVSGEYFKREKVSTFTKPPHYNIGNEELSKLVKELVEQYCEPTAGVKR
ncbi:MAG: winged helix-turn-helix transcriptional regulator [Candidatus Micrarchaeia archaeon]